MDLNGAMESSFALVQRKSSKEGRMEPQQQKRANFAFVHFNANDPRSTPLRSALSEGERWRERERERIHGKSFK